MSAIRFVQAGGVSVVAAGAVRCSSIWPVGAGKLSCSSVQRGAIAGVVNQLSRERFTGEKRYLQQSAVQRLPAQKQEEEGAEPSGETKELSMVQAINNVCVW